MKNIMLVHNIMSVLIIYGQLMHWHNFTSDVLLPHFHGKINAIKIFTNVHVLKNYLNNEGKWYKNYVMPLNETHMYELHAANIKALMPPIDKINVFCEKKKFLFYVVQNHLEQNYPRSYIDPHPTTDRMVIVKPFWGGNSQGCYVANLKDLGHTVFKTNLAQDYIKNNIEYAGYGVAKNGKIVHSFCYIRDYGNRVYVKGDASDNTKQYRIEMDASHRAVIEKFLLPVKFTGAFCADYKLHNNEVCIFEINARLGGSLGAAYNRNDAAAMILNMIEVFN